MNVISRDTVRTIVEAAVVAFSSYGMKLERVDDSIRPANVYVSVPESSELKFSNVEDEEVAGAALANQVQGILKEDGIETIHIKYRIRAGERWTKAMSRQAEAAFKRELDICACSKNNLNRYTGGVPS